MLHARLAQQHLQADIAGLRHLFQPRRHNNAVLAHNGHHIRHRPQCDQVGIAVKHRVRVALERADQFERHAHARQAVERIGAVRPFVVHDRVCFRQGVVALVVVGDHHLHAQLARGCDLRIRRDTGVHGDQQARALLIELLHRLAGQAVAFAQAVGDVVFAHRAAAAQVIHHDAGGGDAVHIVVAVNNDMFAPPDRAADHRGRFIHIGQQERIVQAGTVTAQVIRRCLRGIDPARREHCGRQRRIAAFTRERIHARPVGRGDHPSLCFHKNSLIYFLLRLLYQNTPKSSTFLCKLQKAGIPLWNPR